MKIKTTTKYIKYEQKASAIWENFNIPYDERKNAVEKLLKEFCILNGGY